MTDGVAVMLGDEVCASGRGDGRAQRLHQAGHRPSVGAEDLQVDFPYGRPVFHVFSPYEREALAGVPAFLMSFSRKAGNPFDQRPPGRSTT
ncbi:hypothetical protein [Microbispora sp. NPDC049125]|uniref:hypothetical protein n=1 Tax=Microbispora sp. NPDC049125 TaxID=3154929 RepID=UPI00346571C4